MTTVYLVVGESRGNRGHLSKWPVAAYPEREAAELHVQAITARMPELAAAYELGRSSRREDWDAGEKVFREFSLDKDAADSVRYGDAAYSVVEVPLVRHPDEYIEAIGRQ